MAGGTTNNQKIRNSTIQSALSMTQSNSRRIMVIMVMTAPINSHRQASAIPKMATPDKPIENQSVAGSGSVESFNITVFPYHIWTM